MNGMPLRNKSPRYAHAHTPAHPTASAVCPHVPLPLRSALHRAPQPAAAEVLTCFLSHRAAEARNVLEGAVQYQGIHMEHPRQHEVLFLQV